MAFISVEIDKEELELLKQDIGAAIKARGDKVIKFKDAGGMIMETIDGMVIGVLVDQLLQLSKKKEEEPE